MWYLLWCREVLVGLQRCDAMRSPVVWSDRGWKAQVKIVSRESQASDAELPQEKGAVYSHRTALPVHCCISMRCTGPLAAAQRRWAVCELYAALDRARNHLEMELIHANKENAWIHDEGETSMTGGVTFAFYVVFSIRLWRFIAIKWTRFQECYHLCLYTHNKEKRNPKKKKKGVKWPLLVLTEQTHHMGNIYLGFQGMPGAKLYAFPG